MQIELGKLRNRARMTAPPGKEIARGLWYTDNKSDILAVAHLDYVQQTRHFEVVKIGKERIIYCGQLDDRLGVYTILDLFPLYGLNYDILLTTDEEKCQSTAQYFATKKQYRWTFSFDRAGREDVALYQYWNERTGSAVKAAGLHPAHGSYSDIVELDTLDCCGFNWCTGLRDGHSATAHVYETDYLYCVLRFLQFWKDNQGVCFLHEFGKLGESCDWCGVFSDKLQFSDDGFLCCPDCLKDDWLGECDLCGREQIVEYHPASDAFLCEDCAEMMRTGEME